MLSDRNILTVIAITGQVNFIARCKTLAWDDSVYKGVRRHSRFLTLKESLYRVIKNASTSMTLYFSLDNVKDNGG